MTCILLLIYPSGLHRMRLEFVLPTLNLRLDYYSLLNLCLYYYSSLLRHYYSWPLSFCSR
jgi:hypothetical protein